MTNDQRPIAQFTYRCVAGRRTNDQRPKRSLPTVA